MEKETSVIICPYDNNHRIHRERFQRHIIKCAKNFPPKYKETCPFNATHIMFHAELEEHVQLCPDRRYFNPEDYCYVKKHGSLRSCPPSELEKANVPCDESWEGGNIMDDRVHDFSETSSIISDSEIPPTPSTMPVIDPMKPLRAPKGCGLPMMMEFSEESGLDDVESVASSWTFGGRGSKLPQGTQIYSKLGIGRGRGVPPHM